MDDVVALQIQFYVLLPLRNEFWLSPEVRFLEKLEDFDFLNLYNCQNIVVQLLLVSL